MSNQFSFRYTRHGMNYHAEYRLAHWSGHRVVRDSKGKPIPFQGPIAAALNAAQALIDELNGNPSFWTGKTGNEARAAAEAHFTRTTDGGEGKEG